MNERLLDIPTRQNDKLSYREIMFMDEYLALGVANKAYMKAYGMEDNQKASEGAARLMRKKEVREEIEFRQRELRKSSILSAQDILEMYTSIALGEVKDQFGLDASLKDRLSALNELAKRQIDLPAKTQAHDNTLTINLNRPK